ncbi:MAG: ubiquitin carboxyl-terminal hydrolase 14, partial [Amphiamblys sp. WSBS2006]
MHDETCSHIADAALQADTGKVVGECALCFENNVKAMEFCVCCRLFFCKTHTGLHKEKTQHTVTLSETAVHCGECNKTVDSPGTLQRITLGQDSSPETCPHSATEESPQKVKQKCTYCPIEENLWVCLSCGHTGCGRKQYDGSGGDEHALQHFTETQHPLACKVGTVAKRKGDVYCYQCDRAVSAPIDTLQRFGVDIDRSARTEKTVGEAEEDLNAAAKFNQLLSTKIEHMREEKTRTRIGNIGNSCYLSAFFYVLSRVAENIPPVEAHYRQCLESPPDCVLCQSLKLLSALGSDGKTVYPHTLKSCLLRAGLPLEGQQDLAEMFLLTLNLLEAFGAEWAKRFCTKTLQVSHCAVCANSKKEAAQSLFLSVPIPDSGTASIETLFLEYFSPTETGERCPCGNAFETKQALAELPGLLSVQLNRFGYAQGGVYKKETEIACQDVLFLDAFVAPLQTPDGELVETLLAMGVDRKLAEKALSST